ncbi:MAG: hypothetical protein ACREM1_15915 [Longimicrobiales bacterium]
MRVFHWKVERACVISLLLVFRGVAPVAAQVPFDSGRWEIESQQHLLLEYQGRPALYLYNGVAMLRDASLRNGVIEFDIAFSGERGFTGARWRATSPGNYEEFYIRPHQSGNPDANQYTPVFNGQSGWQLYHGEGYGAPVEYPLNRWIHVKVVFWEDQAQVFIDDMIEPALRVPELKHDVASGGLGLSASAPTYFSGFTYRPIDAPPFERMAGADTVARGGVLVDWEVSSPFEESRLEQLEQGGEEWLAALSWQRLRSEATGITNLARLHSIDGQNNTVIALARIRSDRDQIKKLRFGYSDRVRVYVNGQPVYMGDNTFVSRDYRYLGTIGLFDGIYLPLREGDNEVWFAVTEAFGGWGLLASIEDQTGIQFRAPGAVPEG